MDHAELDASEKCGQADSMLRIGCVAGLCIFLCPDSEGKAKQHKTKSEGARNMHTTKKCTKGINERTTWDEMISCKPEMKSTCFREKKNHKYINITEKSSTFAI